MEIQKLLLIVFVAFLLISYWLIPKTKLSKHFKMNATVFIITSIIGIIIGLFGLAATFAWPHLIVEKHIMWLIILPYSAIDFYWMIVRKIKKTSDICDEKQEYDMIKAGSTTLALSVMAMVFLFLLYKGDILEGITWFPCYFFSTVLFYSSSTLYYFKKDGKAMRFI